MLKRINRAQTTTSCWRLCLVSYPLMTHTYISPWLSGQKEGTAGVVVDHSKASGLVEVFDLMAPTFYRVSRHPK